MEAMSVAECSILDATKAVRVITERSFDHVTASTRYRIQSSYL
jgi:hypothetical protein